MRKFKSVECAKQHLENRRYLAYQRIAARGDTVIKDSSFIGACIGDERCQAHLMIFTEQMREDLRNMSNHDYQAELEEVIKGVEISPEIKSQLRKLAIEKNGKDNKRT